MDEAPKTPPPPLSSPPIKVEHHDDVVASSDSRPSPSSHISIASAPPKFASPMRHHKRAPSAHREIKETLDARVQYGNDDEDGPTQHHINQYTIKEEIGRGSYGAVHLATDQYGTEYAVKEFSKVRLRKRAQSHILRQGPRGMPRNILPKAGLGGPGQNANPRLGGARAGEAEDALYLIREEVAIMKKLNHPNLVQLLEVLDDPEEDSLYMVMEMCKKGVVMKVGMEQVADPYSLQASRYWFRDLILGIEYLHEQGVIHRDIKPDNLLISDDDVLKVVDFGVSEMFEKAEDMRTAKSAGSPAFLPPELCGKHGDVSGKAADIWGMGVTLYCLRYGKIPFYSEGMLQIFEAIKNEEPQYPEDEDHDFLGLMRQLLEKDPEKRIKMPELREHTWVTRGGTDRLLSKEENCAHSVEPPNELELNRAFTRKMNHLLCIMKAIHRFKALLAARRRRLGQDGAGSASNPPGISDDNFDPARAKAKAAEIEVVAEISRRRKLVKMEEKENENENGGSKGHAHDVSDVEPLFLGIGTGSRDDFAMDEASPDVVADSPTAVDYNIYDRAYEEAVEERLRANSSHRPTLYLTRFVKEKEHFRKLEELVDNSSEVAPRILDRMRSSGQSIQHNVVDKSSASLTHLVSKLGITGAKDESSKPAS